MNENAYVELLRGLLASGAEARQNAVAISAEATAAYPHSAELWCLRGDALQMATDLTMSPFPEEALACYERALDIDPASIEALESKGFFLDVAYDDFQAAERAFRQALALGGSVDTYVGLARVLAQAQRKQEALDLLDPSQCPFSDAQSVSTMRREIQKGIWD